MRDSSLVCIRGLLGIWLLFSGLLATPAIAQNNTFGEVIPLPGHIDEVVLDEQRGLVYAANFSAGRVEVVSMATNQRVKSFLASSRPTAMTSAAMSMDKKWLAVTEVLVEGLPGISVINLNDPGDRRHFPMIEQPLGIAFGVTGRALVVTMESLQLFDPIDGSLELLFDYDEPPPSNVELPVPIPTFPREVVTTNLIASGDGRWIFGIAAGAGGGGFVFAHKFGPGGLTTDTLRLRTTGSLVNAPAFNQVSAAANGDYFMAGQILFNNKLRVVADSPEVPDERFDLLFGGHVIDSEIDTVFASFNTLIENDLPGQESTGILNVMDSDNLYVRRKIRIPERASGRFVTDSQGDNLYAVGQSGLIHVPIGELSSVPVVEVNPEDRNLLFEFNFCAREPQSQILRVESPDGGPAQVTLSVPEGVGGGVLFEPQQFTTPQDVKVTVDPEAFGTVQGTGRFEIQFQTNAVNIPHASKILANIRDVDQKGNFFPVAGELTDIVADPIRDRFYVLNSSRFEVLMFDSNTFRLLGRFRTGNSPTWMTLDHTRGYLIVTNSRGENVTVINLVQNRSQGLVFLPYETLQAGHYPMSAAADNASVLIATKVSASSPEPGQIVVLNVPFFGTTKPATLGIFFNSIDPLTALVSSPNLSGVAFAMSDGRTAYWESLTRKLILAREDYSSLSGAVGSGIDFFLFDNHVVNSSLVAQLDLPDVEGGQESSGFAVLPDGRAVRSIRPIDGIDSGVLQQFDPRDFRVIRNPVRMVDTPPPAANTQGFPFTRTLAGLPDGRLVSLGTAGLLEFPVGYETGLDTPRVSAMVNAADFTVNMAPGGLVTFFGENLAGQTASAGSMPLPTVLGGSCVTVNGAALPLLFVSPTQINAQLPFTAGGTINTIVRNAGGVSDISVAEVEPAAPAVFNVSGSNTGSSFAAVFRADDNKLVTPSTPLRPNDRAVIFLTGLGPVTPAAIEGHPAAESPLSETAVDPFVLFGDSPGILGDIEFSGLAPGFVGLNQINVLVPGDVPRGMQVPLTVASGNVVTTVQVRIVDRN